MFEAFAADGSLCDTFDHMYACLNGVLYGAEP